MRVLDVCELNLVSGGADFSVRPANKPSDAKEGNGKAIGWCWGLGNIGGSNGRGNGVTNLPKHEGANCCVVLDGVPCDCSGSV